jgi:hypothetical protein
MERKMPPKSFIATVITLFLAVINTCYAEENTAISFTEDSFYPESIAKGASERLASMASSKNSSTMTDLFQHLDYALMMPTIGYGW